MGLLSSIRLSILKPPMFFIIFFMRLSCSTSIPSMRNRESWLRSALRQVSLLKGISVPWKARPVSSLIILPERPPRSLSPCSS